MYCKLLYHYNILLLKPRYGIKRIIEENLDLKSIACMLFLVGLIRGTLETVWLYLIVGKFSKLILSLRSLDWYLFNSGPFIVGNITSVYFLWMLVAFIVFKFGRFLGGRGNFNDMLKVYGIFMISYALIGVINYVHVLVDMPFVCFKASEYFNPAIGVGQEIVFLWLIVISYFVARDLHNLSRTDSILISSLPVLVGITLYIISVSLFFSFYKLLPFKVGLTSYFLSGILYVIFTSVLSVILFKWGKDHNNFMF